MDYNIREEWCHHQPVTVAMEKHTRTLFPLSFDYGFALKAVIHITINENFGPRLGKLSSLENHSTICDLYHFGSEVADTRCLARILNFAVDDTLLANILTVFANGRCAAYGRKL